MDDNAVIANFRISGLADVSSQQSLNEGLLPPLQSDYDDFDATAGLQPQGTTKRPQQLAASGIQPPITDTVGNFEI